MNDVWIKFIEQAPWASALCFVVYLFLRHQKDQEASRAANAANMAKERREHELQINNMWAINIKALIDKHEETMALIAKTLSDHEKASQERYEKMNITKDLIKAVKDRKEQING